VCTVIVRPATIDDVEGLAEVHVRSWQEAYVGQLPQAYLDGLTPGPRAQMWMGYLGREAGPDVFVAVEDDQIVAFVAVNASTDDDAVETTGTVGSIYARAHHWGTGIGRRLMELGLDRLRERGFADVTLWVLDTNTRARRFYGASGWKLDGTTKRDEIGGMEVIEVRYRRSLVEEL
jgi:GNAT superfamily N-acetyltransferase